jgi:hypothetical protein
MDEHSKQTTVSVKLGLSEHYLVGRMLMLREKLSVQQWQVYDRSAEAICTRSSAACRPTTRTRPSGTTVERGGKVPCGDIT